MVLIGKILIFILQALGLFPYQYDVKGKLFVPAKGVFRIYHLATLIISLGLLFNTVLEYYDIYFFKYKTPNASFVVLINLFQTLFYYFIPTIGQLLILFNENKFMKILNEICDILHATKTLQNDFVGEKKLKRFILITMIYLFVIYLSSMSISVFGYFDASYSWYEASALSISILCQSYGCTGFMVANLVIAHTYRIINLELKNCTTKIQSKSFKLKKLEALNHCCELSDRLDYLTSLQLRIYEVTQELKGFMGAWLLVSLFILFTAILSRVSR